MHAANLDWMNTIKRCVIYTAHAYFLRIFHNHLGIASDGLKGRVYEVSLADLQNDEVAFRKFKLITEDVQGKNCLTNFHGMDLTRDKMCSMVKKWQVMITFLQMVLNLIVHISQLSEQLQLFGSSLLNLGSDSAHSYFCQSCPQCGRFKCLNSKVKDLYTYLRSCFNNVEVSK